MGFKAGEYNQSENSIAIGKYAGRTDQHQDTIVLNATGNDLNTDQPSATYVKPIRTVTDTTGLLPLFYNPSTGEIVQYNAP
jgi:hypothetical protein